MRVSDDQRQRTIDELRRHCQAGRLEVEEYGARIEKAMASHTLQDLDELTADLPMIRIADPAGMTARQSVAPSWGTVHPLDDPSQRLVRSKLISTLLMALTAVVVLSAVGLGLSTSWAWSFVLLSIWLIGVGQGRLIGVLAKRTRR